MKTFTLLGRFAAVVLLYLMFATSAQAQATRTWVSGVGDDANPCSRTAPCKTFAGAISKTAASGSISVLDPGGYGAVTITKSITIESDGELAGILNAGTNGVIVNAGANDVVTLRGLQFNGALTGINGIRFIAGGRLIVENCTIQGVTTNGIDFSPSTAAKLLVRDTTISRAAGGSAISITPTGAGTATAVLDNVRLFSNKSGVTVNSGNVSIRNSVVSQNDLNGVFANSSGATVNINIDSSIVSDSGVGVRALNATSNMFVSNTTITGNGTGVGAFSGASISTYKNNRLFANTSPGSFSAILAGD